MKNEVTVYKNEYFKLPSILDEHQEPWFVIQDVCKNLGLTNTSRTSRLLDEDEIRAISVLSPSYRGKQGQRKRTRISIISESGLYFLMFRSNQESAKAFRKWVTGTVLPALRKDGFYNMVREKCKPDFKQMTHDVFSVSYNKEQAVATVGRLINIVNQAITGMKSQECKDKHGCSPRDWIMMQNKKLIKEYEQLQLFATNEFEKGKGLLQIKHALKVLGYKV